MGWSSIPPASAPSSSTSKAAISILSSEDIKTYAEAFGVPEDQVGLIFEKEGIRGDLVELLQQKYPHDLGSVWIDGNLTGDIHVSGKKQEVLDLAKEKYPNVITHLVKYSYKEMESTYQELNTIIHDELDPNFKSFANFQPTEATIYVGLIDLTDEQKNSSAYKKVQEIITKHPDLIKLTNDVEKYGIQHACEAALLTEK